MPHDLHTAYLRWTFVRAALARGWWTTTSVYLVVVAHLTPVELVLIGTFQAATVLVVEVPAGVLADSVSRRLSLVVAHVISGTGMAMAGFVTSFPVLVIANCLWGMGWAFQSGADVAWITDELDAPERIDRVLSDQGRRDLLGNPVGLAVAGALAWATSLETAMVCAGVATMALAGMIARWPETRFTRAAAGRPWSSALAILRRGLRLARWDRVVVAVLVSTVLLHGGNEGFGRLRERRLVVLGFPTAPDPIVWFTVLGLASVVIGVVLLRIVTRRIDEPDLARRAHVWSCVLAAGGLVVFALAPNIALAVIAVLVVSGFGALSRIATTIRVNRRTTSDVRATAHSLLSWAENLGEIVFGLTLAAVAGLVSAAAAIMAAAGLLVAAAWFGARTD